jgi:hypothetical protein
MKNCTNLQQWKEAILKVWLERTKECEFLQYMVTSMPTRMLEVIEREGERPDTSIFIYCM